MNGPPESETEVSRLPSPREAWEAWRAKWMTRRRTAMMLLVAAAIALPYLASCIHYWPLVIDDAYITFRYSHHLLMGHGLRFNPGDMPVEGYTNFLWMLLSAFWLLLGCDVMAAAKAMGLVSGLGTMLVAWRFSAALRRRDDAWNLLPVFILSTNAHFAFWSVQGMETILHAFLVLLTYHLFLRETEDPRRRVLSPAAGFLAVLTRIDSLWFLLPLAAWAAWKLLRRETPPRRVLLAAGAGAALLAAYMAWKYAYFGDLLPNTYYAKIAGEELPAGRGAAHLYEYYLNQAGWASDRFRLHGVAWINLWLPAVLMCLLLGRARVWLLVLAPIAMQAWYVLRVEGDWMPGFRFFQVALPFLACSVPLCIDLWRERIAARPFTRALVPGFLVAMAVLAAWEQSRIETAYVFGRDPLWFERPTRWLAPANLRAQLNSGFTPALQDVAEHLLLNTADDAWILTSDIGAPMWFSLHLNLLDVDGLTDKVIADAPSVRRETYGAAPIRTPAQTHQQLVEEAGGADHLTRAMRRSLLLRAEQQSRALVLDRALRYSMEHHEPEYILLFVQHGGRGPDEPGYVYPELLRRAAAHPQFAHYTEDWRSLKAAPDVWNHLYRRDDVPEAIEPAMRRARAARALRFNPRVAHLAPSLYIEMIGAGDLHDEPDRALVLRTVRYAGANAQVMRSMLYLASTAGDVEMAESTFAAARPFTSQEPWLYLHSARALAAAGRREQAIQRLDEALDRGIDDPALRREREWLTRASVSNTEEQDEHQ